jgi:hypothetical protein
MPGEEVYAFVNDLARAIIPRKSRITGGSSASMLAVSQNTIVCSR